MKKKNQDAGLTLKELYKVIRAHSDYMKLSKKAPKKLKHTNKKKSSLKTLGNLESKY